MKPISLSALDILRLLSDAATTRAEECPSVVLPHGAGRLRFEQFDLAPGVHLTVRQGVLEKPFSVRGQDCHGVEIAFQLGSNRRVALDGRMILAEQQPIVSVYSTSGGQWFEIVEEPTRDATFVELSLAPGATAHLCPVLDRSITAMLDKARTVGTARLFTRPMSPAIAEVAWRLARPGLLDTSRFLAARRDAFALLCLLTSENLNDQPANDRDRALQAGEILRAQLANPLDVAALADAVGLSTHRLSAAFRAEFDLSPSMFVRSERMRRAADRLRSGPVPLARLAWELGYRSTSHFVQAFREWHGVTPARFGRTENCSENDIVSR